MVAWRHDRSTVVTMRARETRVIAKLRRIHEFITDARFESFFFASIAAIRMSALEKPEIFARGNRWSTAELDVYEPRDRDDGDARRARRVRPRRIHR